MPNAEEIRIIDGLRAGGHSRRRFENELWERFRSFIGLGISKYSLSNDDVRDAYDDTICSVIVNIVTGKYQESSNALLKTYAEAIFHHKCIDRLDRHKGVSEAANAKNNLKNPQSFSQFLVDMLPNPVKNTIELIIEKEDQLKMQRCLEKLGETCREILKLFGGNYKDKEIAVMLNYSSSEVAKQSRYRCMEKLTEIYMSMYKYE
jgi:RNA polymerase sigma-70 factor (ECF subfamily)